MFVVQRPIEVQFALTGLPQGAIQCQPDRRGGPLCIQAGKVLNQFVMHERGIAAQAPAGGTYRHNVVQSTELGTFAVEDVDAEFVGNFARVVEIQQDDLSERTH